MKQVIFVDFKPQTSKKEHDLQYVTERLKVSVSDTHVQIIQFMTVPREVRISKEDFNTIVDLLPSVPFPVPEEVVSEVKTHVPQQVIQADFANKSFRKAFEVEQVTKLQEAEGHRTVIGHGRCSIFTWQNLKGHNCVYLVDGVDHVAFYTETFEKLVAEVKRQDEKLECKVLSFSRASLQKAS